MQISHFSIEICGLNSHSSFVQPRSGFTQASDWKCRLPPWHVHQIQSPFVCSNLELSRLFGVLAIPLALSLRFRELRRKFIQIGVNVGFGTRMCVFRSPCPATMFAYRIFYSTTNTYYWYSFNRRSSNNETGDVGDSFEIFGGCKSFKEVYEVEWVQLFSFRCRYWNLYHVYQIFKKYTRNTINGIWPKPGKLNFKSSH